MDEDDDATEIIPARSGGGGKTAMPSDKKAFGSFATYFLAIFILTVITFGVLSWCNRRIQYRIQWIRDVLTIGKKKADINFQNHSQENLDGNSMSDSQTGFE